jgi:DNA replication protein DnaC
MIKEYLLLLRMHGALDALEGISQIQEKEAYVLALLKAEQEYRELKKMSTRLTAASFPSDKEWDEIDPSLNPKIDFAKVKALGNGEFIRRKENLCLMGKQGTGKSHSLVALGRQLCRQGYSVKFCTAHSLVTGLEEAKEAHKLSKLMKALQKPSLLIIDELGFIPFTSKGANLLFNVFTSRYEIGSIAVSTNLSFDKWIDLFQSPELTAALVDRFTQNAHLFVYAGQSIRLMKRNKKKEEKDMSGALPPAPPDKHSDSRQHPCS